MIDLDISLALAIVMGRGSGTGSQQAKGDRAAQKRRRQTKETASVDGEGNGAVCAELRRDKQRILFTTRKHNSAAISSGNSSLSHSAPRNLCDD